MSIYMLFPTFKIPINQKNDGANLLYEKEYLYQKGYSFNFETGDIDIDGSGRAKIADETEEWKQWCIRQMYTERNAFMAYSDRIGCEIDDAINQPTRKAQESMIEKTISEAILADPFNRSVQVSGFTHIWGVDSLHTTANVTGHNGAQITINAEYKTTGGVYK